jgi:hypothetical protein
MDADGLQNTLFNVLLYALLELISLVLLDIVLRRLVQFSPVSQLAFVLRTQWKMVQSKLVLWVLYVVQSSLVHCARHFTRYYPFFPVISGEVTCAVSGYSPGYK